MPVTYLEDVSEENKHKHLESEIHYWTINYNQDKGRCFWHVSLVWNERKNGYTKKDPNTH